MWAEIKEEENKAEMGKLDPQLDWVSE